MEALLPPDLLHVDNDDNQLFNTEPEINHTAMADSLRKSLAELSIDSPLRNHANFATISAKAWEESPGSQASLNPPIPDTALADANTEGDSATGGAITRARCKYTRGDVKGKWLELRQRLQASGVDAPLPLEPSLTIPKSFLATMMVSLPHLGEDVRKRGPPEYADFAKSVPQENPFIRAAAQDAEDSNASTHGSGTNQSNIIQYNKRCSGSQINYHYHTAAPPAAAQPAATAPAAAPPAASAPAASAPFATAPAAAPAAAAPAAAAPPSSKAQQLADMKAMFEQGLIPSHEIYEDKVRQILGLE